MFGPVNSCPACHNTALVRSRGGPLGRLARLVCLVPIRCMACHHRFWRLTFRPPLWPAEGRRRRAGGGSPAGAEPVV